MEEVTTMPLMPGNKLPAAYRYDECLAAIKEQGEPLRAGNNTHLIVFPNNSDPVIEVLFYAKPIARMHRDRVVLYVDDIPATPTTADRMNRILAGYRTGIEFEPNRPATGIISVQDDGRFYFGHHTLANEVTVYGPSLDN